jgi:2'-5' RNA ligase
MNDHVHRSFAAIFPPKEILKRLTSVQSEIASLVPHARWVHSETFHFTLEFLGDKPISWLEQLSDLLRKDIDTRPFQIVINRPGCFPSPRSPKVFWLGSDEKQNEELHRVAAVVRKSCSRLGHLPAEEPFRPHMTIGRAKGKIDIALIQNLETVTFQPIPFVCSEIRVMKSQLASTGSTYITLFTIPLK